jgi:hypothetical protein
MKRIALALTVLPLFAPVAVDAAQWGRAVDPERKNRFTLHVGDRSPIVGSVEETDRPLDEHRDTTNVQGPESFSFEELGLAKSDTTYGLGFERQGKWVTFSLNATHLDAKASGVAPRDLFIGVKGVRFDGREYDYQQIPAGTPYVGEIDLVAGHLRFAITPVTLNPGGAVQFVPWVSLGLFLLAGQFDIDAGPAQGVILYESPPREYVVGGRSRGEAGALSPEIGLGGELAMQLTERSRLVLQGTYGWADFSASTSDLGVSSRNEKDIDMDYRALDGRLLLELPLGRSSNFLVGVEYRKVDIEALAEAKDRPVEEVVEIREKFNKIVNLELETVVLTVGFRW